MPLYWLSTIGFFLLVTLSSASRATIDPVATRALLARSLSFLAWTTGPPPSFPLVYVGWSLEYEMLFYAIVAAWLAMVRRPTLPVAITLAVPIALGRAVGAETGSAAAYFLCNPILVEFLLGVIIADLLAGERPYPAMVVTAVALATVPYGGWGQRVWLVGLPSAALVGTAAWLDRRRTPLAWSTRALARLGDASYSMYLAQAFTISAACKVLMRVAPQVSLIVSIVAATAATVAASYAVFLLVERPLLRLAHRLDTSRGERRRAASPIVDQPLGPGEAAASPAS